MMNAIKIIILMILAGIFFTLGGCGGGGSSEAGPTTLKLTLATTNVPDGTLIGGIQGKITLPPGTSIRLDPLQTGSVLSGLFTLTGDAATSHTNNSFVAPTFTFAITNANGFAGGKFATLTVDVLSGSPAAAHFIISNPIVVDNIAHNNESAKAPISGAAFTIE